MQGHSGPRLHPLPRVIRMATEGDGVKSRASAALFSAFVVLGTGQAVGNADTPKFPDIDSYPPVNVQDYMIELPNPGRAPTKKVYFATPDGVPCSFAPSSGGITGAAGCSSAHLPGVAPLGLYTSISTTRAPYATHSSPYTDGSIQGHKLVSLPPFRSISVDGMICGVDDKGTTACKGPQGRGFILSQSWSGWLPKVQ
jgi:hypothetical protein